MKRLARIGISLVLSPLILLGMLAGAVAFGLAVGWHFAGHHLERLIE